MDVFWSDVVPVLHTHFPPYSFFSPEKWVYTQFSPRKNEYILIFPGEKLVYTHFSGGKNEYVTPAIS